jgi:hypothetical protein
MRSEARSFGEAAHFLHQSRLADSGFAADINDLTAAPRKARGDQAFDLIKLGRAPNEGGPTGRGQIG